MKGSSLTWREHLTAIYRQTDTEPKQLAGPEFPDVLDYLWDWYIELHNSKNAEVITYTEIRNWAELTGRRPASFEIRIIKKVDLEYMKSRDK